MAEKAGTILLERPIRGDFIFRDIEAGPGILEAFSNPYGAISVKAKDGRWLGLKPGEFSWITMEPWLEKFWDGDQVRPAPHGEGE